MLYTGHVTVKNEGNLFEKSYGVSPDFLVTSLCLSYKKKLLLSLEHLPRVIRIDFMAVEVELGKFVHFCSIFTAYLVYVINRI